MVTFRAVDTFVAEITVIDEAAIDAVMAVIDVISVVAVLVVVRSGDEIAIFVPACRIHVVAVFV